MKSLYLFILLASLTGVAFRPPKAPMATFHYYVSAICFCTPNKGEDKALHLFISPANIVEGDRYSDVKFKTRFIDQLKLDYDQWFVVGYGDINFSTFTSAEEASDARRSFMAKKKTDGYKLHNVVW